MMSSTSPLSSSLSSTSHLSSTLSSTVQSTCMPGSLSSSLLEHLRTEASSFRHANRQEEPPLRTLEHGLHGEGVKCEEPPHPYMVQSSSGRWYHGYRCDQAKCDEAAHTSPRLCSLFGPKDPESEASFRAVLGYAAGLTPSLQSSCPHIVTQLTEALSPACRRVYPGAQVARCFSVYANLLLPGHVIGMHLDVPEFVGVDRSTCPSWLLVAAHCSGLFTQYRVHNVTAICYPAPCEGGALAVHHPTQGGVFLVEADKVLVLDTDSCFHYSQRVGPTNTVQQVPHLPDLCNVKVVEEEGRVVWKVVEGDKEISRHPEEELRFSVSAKFHMFQSEEEADLYYSGERERLTAEMIVKELVEDLGKAGLLPDGWGQHTPLYSLAPLLVNHYILPRAPTSAELEEVWSHVAA